MKTARTLILGSAAALIAISGAQAADLPVKAKAVEYVQDLLALRRRLLLHPGHRHLHQARRLSARRRHLQRRRPWCAGLERRFRPAEPLRDYFIARSRMALTIDTRTATEYGVVRTFGQGDFQFNNFGTSNPSDAHGAPRRRRATRSPPPAAATSRSSTSSSSSPASPSVSRLGLCDAVAGFPGQHQFEPARRPEHRHRRQQHPVHRPVRQRRVGPASVSTIRPSGIARRSTT